MSAAEAPGSDEPTGDQPRLTAVPDPPPTQDEESATAPRRRPAAAARSLPLPALLLAVLTSGAGLVSAGARFGWGWTAAGAGVAGAGYGAHRLAQRRAEQAGGRGDRSRGRQPSTPRLGLLARLRAAGAGRRQGAAPGGARGGSAGRGRPGGGRAAGGRFGAAGRAVRGLATRGRAAAASGRKGRAGGAPGAKAAAARTGGLPGRGRGGRPSSGGRPGGASRSGGTRAGRRLGLFGGRPSGGATRGGAGGGRGRSGGTRPGSGASKRAGGVLRGLLGGRTRAGQNGGRAGRAPGGRAAGGPGGRAKLPPAARVRRAYRRALVRTRALRRSRFGRATGVLARGAAAVGMVAGRVAGRGLTRAGAAFAATPPGRAALRLLTRARRSRLGRRARALTRWTRGRVRRWWTGAAAVRPVAESAPTPSTTPAAPPLPPLPQFPSSLGTGPVTPGRSKPMSVFAGPTEALNDAVNQWQPHNANDQASAQAMRVLLAEVPDFIEELARCFQTLAEKTIDEIHLESGGDDLLHTLAQNIRSQVEPMREIAAQMDQLHDDRLRHMRSDDPRAGSWDWKGNQDEDVPA